MSISTVRERNDAEQLLTEFYAHLGKPEPRFIWFDGPLSCLFAAHMLRVSGAALTPLSFEARFSEQFRGRRWRDLDVQLKQKVQNLGTSRGDAFDPEFYGWFWGEFWRQCTQQGLESLTPMNPVGCQMEPMRWLGGAWRGELVAPAPAGEREGEAPWLDELRDSCGWWFPFERVVLCSDEPRRIHIDGQGRLHAERGPALRLSRAHLVYAWHGTRIPARWIERRDEVDPREVLSGHDPAQRQALTEILGWAKVIATLPSRVVDADPDPQIGTLLVCDLPGAPASRFLRVRCGTGREFALRVPRELMSARAANAWTYGLTAEQYQLEART